MSKEKIDRHSPEGQEIIAWARLAMHSRRCGYSIFRSSHQAGWLIRPSKGGAPGSAVGAHAEIYHQPQSRITATRVALGTIVAGFPGALVGGMARKTHQIIYVVIRLENGRTMISETKAEWPEVMNWVSEFNRLSGGGDPS